MRQYGILVMAVVILLSISLRAQVPGKLYLGGSVGSSFIETKPQDVGGEELKIDKNGFAYKFFAGFKLMKFLGVEADYRDLGTVKNSLQSVEFESNVKGFDVFATGTFNMAMLELFAKAGYFFWNSEVKGGNFSVETDDSDFAWGIGAAISLGKIGVRAEWESFNAGDLENLSMISAGVVYTLM